MRNMVFGAALLLALVGCGGEAGGIGEIFEVTPRRATVAPGENTVIHVTAVEIGFQRYTFSIDEGSAGGTVVPNVGDNEGNALYTAPATPGTYHVRAGIVVSPSETRLKTVTFVVR